MSEALNRGHCVDPATTAFLGLTPQQTLDAVEATGLRCTNVCVQLNSFENRVYQIELHDGSPLVVKLYRPGRWSAAQIREEHQFLHALAQVDISVCDVIELPSGETLSQSGPLMLAIFARQGGRAPEELTMAMSARLGGLVARIHQVGCVLPVEHRLTLNADRLDDTIDWLLDERALPADLIDRYVEAAREVAATLDERLSHVPMHAIHGDLHLGNLILRRDILHVLDFDDMMIGPACQDMWLLLPGRDDHTLRLRSAFLHGYRQFREFDPRWLHLIEPLRGYRYVTYAAWLSRRWHDPMFPHTWPNFGTQKWWQKATQDLEDVLAHLDAPLLPDQIDDWTEGGLDLWDWGESR